MINCAKCGKQTITEVVAGKQTKNCRPCRAIHNNNSKRTPTPILKCEKLPDQGFYKQEKYNIVSNERDEQPEDEQDEQPEQPEDEQPEQPEDEQEAPKQEEQDDTPPKQEKTIRDLLTDIFNKFDELEKANEQQIKKQIELTDVVFSILNKLVANENKFNDFVLQSNLKNNDSTNRDNTNNDNNIFNDIIKQQDLKNKIVINKLDTLIKAVT